MKEQLSALIMNWAVQLGADNYGYVAQPDIWSKQNEERRAIY